MKPRDVWPLVKEAVKSWVDDRAPSMGAALSYYTVFSTAPLLLIVIGVVGRDDDEVKRVEELLDELGAEHVRTE